MFFAVRQFATALKAVPTFYRFPDVRWRVVPYLLIFGARYFAEAARYGLAMRLGATPRFAGPERATVILLSYGRIANMAPLASAFLRLPFVERVVVSNNNPRYAIADWVRCEDPRLVLIDQPEPTKPGVRFDLARDYPADYYLMVDDDIFLSPRQIRDLFAQLVERPAVPHGVYGQRYVGRERAPADLFGWRNNVQRFDLEVDVLNRVYAFTRRHLDTYFELLEAIGIRASREVGNGEDVLLSFAGEGSPRIHDLGPWCDCILANDPGIALHSVLRDFMREREALFLEARSHREGLGMARAV